MLHRPPWGRGGYSRHPRAHVFVPLVSPGPHLQGPSSCDPEHKGSLRLGTGRKDGLSCSEVVATGQGRDTPSSPRPGRGEASCPGRPEGRAGPCRDRLRVSGPGWVPRPGPASRRPWRALSGQGTQLPVKCVGVPSSICPSARLGLHGEARCPACTQVPGGDPDGRSDMGSGGEQSWPPGPGGPGGGSVQPRGPGRPKRSLFLHTKQPPNTPTGTCLSTMHPLPGLWPHRLCQCPSDHCRRGARCPGSRAEHGSIYEDKDANIRCSDCSHRSHPLLLFALWWGAQKEGHTSQWTDTRSGQ